MEQVFCFTFAIYILVFRLNRRSDFATEFESTEKRNWNRSRFLKNHGKCTCKWTSLKSKGTKSLQIDQ